MRMRYQIMKMMNPSSRTSCYHILASAVKREDDEKTSEWYRTMDLAVGSSNGLKKAVRSRQL